MYTQTSDYQGDVFTFERYGKIVIAPATLAALFSNVYPNFADQYKVTQEWYFVDTSGNAYSISDYKATSACDADLPTPELFWRSTEPVEFYINTSKTQAENENIRGIAFAMKRCELLAVWIHGVAEGLRRANCF